MLRSAIRIRSLNRVWRSTLETPANSATLCDESDGQFTVIVTTTPACDVSKWQNVVPMHYTCMFMMSE
jgi:hypothetical protein